VDADEPVALLPLVKGGDVGEPDERRGRRRRLPLGFQPGQEPQRSVPTPGAEHRSNGRVRQGAIQLDEPPLVVARQVAVSVKNSGVALNAVATGNNGESRVE